MKKHILTLMFVMIAAVSFGQYQLNYPDIRIGSSITGKVAFKASNILMPHIGIGSGTDSILTIVGGVVKKVPRSSVEITASNGLTKTGNNIALGGAYSSFTIGSTGSTPVFSMTGSLILARNYINSDFNSVSLQSGGQASFGAYRTNSDFHGLNVAPNSIVINDAYNKKGLSGFEKFWKNLTASDSSYYVQKGYIDSLTTGLAPASGSSNYIQNNATSTAQVADINIDGKIKINSGSGPILSTGIEIGAIGTNLIGITAKNASGTLRTLRVEGANISLIGPTTTVNDFNTNAGATFDQGFISNGLGTFNTGFKTLNNPNYYVGSASIDFSNDNTYVNNIKIKAPVSYTGAYTQELQPASGTVALTSNFATGQTIGATAANSSAWNGFTISSSTPTTGQFIVYNGTNYIPKTITATSPVTFNTTTSDIGLNISAAKTALGINDGSALNNIASSATNWGGLPANFSANPVISDILSANPFPIYNSNTFRFEATSSSIYKQALATSLQDVALVNNTTSVVLRSTAANDGNANTLVRNVDAGTKQVKTASGNGSATTISISHGMTGVTTASWVSATANNAASAGIQYVTVDAANINIFYTVAPASGTNNLLYSIEIKP